MVWLRPVCVENAEHLRHLRRAKYRRISELQRAPILLHQILDLDEQRECRDGGLTQDDRAVMSKQAGSTIRQRYKRYV